MISFGNISDYIIDSHWKYFSESDGYNRLQELAISPDLTEAERNYFSRLNNETILKSIIIGTPEILIKEIKYYQDNVVNTIPLLSAYQTFLSFSTWESISEKINRNAEKKLGEDQVLFNKDIYINEFIALKNTVNPHLFPDHVADRITIKSLNKMYYSLKEYFKRELNLFYEHIYSVFNYDDFIESTEYWGAYKLTNELGITVCPYCNRNYIHTSSTENGKTRPELDHFFMKSKYPFLSISLYNLIPSCHICNSNLKGTKDFYKDEHLHPYEEDRIRDFYFDVKYHDDTIEELVADLSKFYIQLTPLTEDPEILKRIENSNKTFQLNELYNYHKDVAQELLFKSVYYNKTKIEELKSILGEEAKIDENFLKRVIIGNYADIKNLGKRSLAKYSYDIVSKTELKTILNL